jgi:AraC-like DNA-binding protein
MKKESNPHRGSDFDDFLKEEGIYEEVTSRAVMRIVIEQLRIKMKRLGINEAELARRMETSRSQVHRLLSPEQSSTTVETLVRAAGALEGRWKIQLVSAK